MALRWTLARHDARVRSRRHPASNRAPPCHHGFMASGTLVCFHAHPDDEVITTGGTIARAVAEGHRVVLVFATRGELGLIPGDLGPETLGERRTREAREAAELLGAHQVEYLGYQDSGMAGDDTNDDAGTFWTADVDEAAAR